MDVLHSKQLIMNPMRDEKLTRFCRTLRLPESSRGLDVGCGKGEFLRRLHEMYNVSGVGIDKSPYCIEECRNQRRRTHGMGPLGGSVEKAWELMGWEAGAGA